MHNHIGERREPGLPHATQKRKTEKSRKTKSIPLRSACTTTIDIITRHRGQLTGVSHRLQRERAPDRGTDRDQAFHHTHAPRCGSSESFGGSFSHLFGGIRSPRSSPRKAEFHRLYYVDSCSARGAAARGDVWRDPRCLLVRHARGASGE